MIKRIAPDKWKHFFVGILMGAVLQVAAQVVFPGRTSMATLAAFTLVVAVSYGFELLSLITGRGHYDIMDAVASIIGGLAGMLLGLGIYRWQFQF
jgi:glycopeptide antibiotics resistance protein